MPSRGGSGGTPRRPDLRITFVVLGMVVGGYGLMQTLVIPVLPAIRAGLHTSESTVTWVITAYLLSASVATPIMGRLGDMWGKDKVLVAAMGALVVGSIMAGLADHAALMIVARSIQGIGGGVFPLSFGIIRDEFPRQRVASVVGAISAVAAGTGGLGIVIGGPIVEAFGFHWLFWIPAIALSIGTGAAFLAVPPTEGRTGGRVNFPAAVLLSGWLLALLLGITEAPSWGWGSARVLGLLVGAAVIALAWVAVEARATHPLIDLRLMRMRTVWTTNLVALLIGGALYAPFAFLPQFLETRRSAGYGFSMSVTVAGLVIFPEALASTVLGLWSGRLAARYGSKAVLTAGLTCTVGSFVVLLFGLSSIWQIVVALTFNGMGIGAAFASLGSLVVQGVPLEHTGVASGMNANIRTIGGALGTAVMSSILTAGVRAGGVPSRHGYVVSFAVIGAATAGAAAVCVAIPGALRHRPVDQAELHPELGLLAGGTLVGDEPE